MSSSDDDGFGGMFGNDEEERKQQEKLLESRNKRVDIQVPRYIKQTDGEKSQSYVESPTPLILKHQPGNHHSLWGHLLWNAGRHIVYMMDTKRIDVKGKSVLELGCGVGAPSFVAALNGARVVCCTDYPDESLLEIVAENAAKVLVLDKETRLIKIPSSNAENGEPSSATTLDEYFTSEEIDKVISDERIRNLVKNKSGLKFSQAVAADVVVPSSADDTNSATIPLPPPPAPKRLPRLNFFVEGLCWGNGDTIEKVCEKSGCIGFDIIFLSDLMFNHICHDQLLATVSRLLARDPASRAYVVFSFHRVLKKEDDLKFFKKCSFYGLKWNLVEENNDYPLMFPDDPGDPAIRKPVNVFELSLTFETNNNNNNNTCTNKNEFATVSSSAPLDKFKYDVVVQGTGLVETLISASCARAGLSVLHLDASAQYGSGFYSSNNKDKFISFVSQNNTNKTFQETPCIDELQRLMDELKANENANNNNNDESTSLEGKLVDLEFSLNDAKKILASRQLNFDTFTTPFLAQSSLILAIAQSQMAEHIEFQNVHRVVSIQKSSDSSSSLPPVVARVPVSRQDVFNSGRSCISMLEARRLMRFIGDISNRSALERDTDVHRERHSNEVVDSLQAAHAEVDLTTTTIEQLLTTKYTFSQNLLDLVTLGGTLLDPSKTSSAAAVSVIFNYLMSIGRYSGSTPYLAPMYSASDLPQIFSRMSAVWGACFALERSAVGIVRVENTFMQGSGDAYSAGTATSTSPTPYDISLPPNSTRIVLDNGQHIFAKCFVCPRVFVLEENQKEKDDTKNYDEVGQTREEFLRAIIVSKRALITWKALEETCSDIPIDEQDKNIRLNCSEPLAVGYCRLFSRDNTKSTNASFLQWTDLLEGSPSHVVVTHITVKRSEFEKISGKVNLPTDLSDEQLFLNLIRDQLFLKAEGNNENDERYASWNKHVVFATSFKWGENEAFLSTVGSRDNMKSLMDGIDVQEAKHKSKHNGKNDDDEDEENTLTTFQAKTIFADLNDALYADETETVFRLVMRCCGRKEDAKEMPIVKGKDPEE